METRNIIITGATSGIGKGVLIDLLSTQTAKVLAFGRNEEAFRELKEIDKGKNLCVALVDLREISEIEEYIKKFCAEFGKISGFVHCAGIEETIPLSLYTRDKVNSIFEINVFTGIEFLRILSKKAYTNENASFVLLSSVMGILGQSGKIGYCSSKAAVIGLVKSAAIELARRGIRVNAVLPGIVNTPMTQNLFQSISEGNRQKIVDMHPLGVGNVEDVVPLVMFLLSNQSRWITGQSMIVDGGYSVI